MTSRISRTASSWPLIAVAAALVIVVLIGGCGAYKTWGTTDTVTFTVKDKERITEEDQDGGTTSKYLVFTDIETFENTDTWLRGKTNSSDLQGKLEIGHKYTCKVNGWRLSITSAYRNLLECEEIKHGG